MTLSPDERDAINLWFSLNVCHAQTSQLKRSYAEIPGMRLSPGDGLRKSKMPNTRDLMSF